VASKARQRKGADETLAQVVAHPLRVQILSILIERAASPKELAAELGAPVANLSYHVRELQSAGLIELVDEKKRRGTVEHFYRGIIRPLMNDAEWWELSAEDRTRLSAGLIQLLLADASQALVSGSLIARRNSHLSRVPLSVDEEGWEELVEIQGRALKDILEVQTTSAKRLAEGDAEGTPIIAALACFEMPSRSGPSSDAT
jgi:DNA-binding transcriptional ArsR family regulator